MNKARNSDCYISLFEEGVAMALRVLLDTDIGDDIDDAWAVTFCLRLPEIRLAGITTVWGDTLTRAALARLLVERAGARDIEVVAGSRDALDRILEPSGQTYAGVLGEEEQRLKRGRTDAVRFMAEKIRENPGLTLISIGPLTNVARLYLEFPSEFASLSRHVMMCGHLIPSKEEPEYNASCDPRATAIALTTEVPKFVVGLDVTMKCGLAEEDLGELSARRTPLAATLHQMTEKWQTSSGALPIMHDPLAVMSAVDEQVAQFKRLKIMSDERGRLRAVEGEPNVNFAVGVDAARLRRRLLEAIR
jgi:purine nucleosidase/pyrimidine-specific ribonucleoside hydrolase